MISTAIHHTKTGFSLIEIILASALFILLTMLLVGIVYAGINSPSQQATNFKATLLTHEATQALQTIKQQSFNSLTPGNYGLAINNQQWQLIPNNDTVEEFTRQITISETDPQTRQITTTISWQAPNGTPQSISRSFHITNWQEPINVNWDHPIIANSINLPTNNNGLKVKIHNNLLFVLQDRTTGSLSAFNLANPSSPNLLSLLNLNPVPNDLAFTDNYAYSVSDNNNAELSIISIQTPNNISLVNSINLDGNQNANDIITYDQYLGIGRQTNPNGELAIMRTTQSSNPQLITQYNNPTNDHYQHLAYASGYIYASVNSNNQEIQIINVTNPNQPQFAGGINLDGNRDVTSLNIINNQLVIGTDNGLLYLYELDNPTTPQLITTYTFSKAINDIETIDGHTYFVAIRDNVASFQILSFQNSEFQSLSNLDVNQQLNDLSIHPDQPIIYAVGNANDQEVIIITNK